MDDGYETATVGPSSGRGSSRAGGSRYEDDQYAGGGWIAFAGVMIAIVGVLNIIYGIAAISNSHFFVRNVNYILSDLNTWGWVLLITGIIQFSASLAIFARAEWGRWVGILTASVNAIIQLVFIPAYPFGSLAMFTIDILVIYGLVAYGGRQGSTV